MIAGRPSLRLLAIWAIALEFKPPPPSLLCYIAELAIGLTDVYAISDGYPRNDIGPRFREGL
jgi:hypothetical protein